MAPSQYRLAAELVEMIHEDFQGFHPGYRGVHAQGRYYAAIFKATPEAKKLSRAVHLQGQPVPVSVRHGHSASGNPWGPAVTPSMSKVLSPRRHSNRPNRLNDPCLFWSYAR